MDSERMDLDKFVIKNWKQGMILRHRAKHQIEEEDNVSQIIWQSSKLQLYEYFLIP